MDPLNLAGWNTAEGMAWDMDIHGVEGFEAKKNK